MIHLRTEHDYPIKFLMSMKMHLRAEHDLIFKKNIKKKKSPFIKSFNRNCNFELNMIHCLKSKQNFQH